MRFEVSGTDSVLIYFGEVISKEVSSLVIGAYNHLRVQNIDGIKSLVPSYTSLMVHYDVMRFNFKTIVSRLSYELQDIDSRVIDSVSKKVKIPVYYAPEVGFDLEDLANKKGLSIEDVIEIHTSQSYFVYAIGFAPGYAYMGLVDEKIAEPRLKTPRKKVPQGSVGIADRQTAIYPSQSPGGWNIIGKTPYLMFDESLESLCPVKVGDEVQFYPITKEDFFNLGGKL